MASAITHDELLAEIERISAEGAEGADGATVAEIIAQTGLSALVVRDRLRKAKARGKLIIGRKPVQSLDGRMLWAPCYTIRSK